jgi:2,3-bisphosphoglycerate-independent phosphoglycerate mutase
VTDLAELPTDRIATVAGRYYAMDRDQRWERTQRALRRDRHGTGEQRDPIEAVRRSYERGITDEFIEPSSSQTVPARPEPRQRDLLQLPSRPRRS